MNLLNLFWPVLIPVIFLLVVFYVLRPRGKKDDEDGALLFKHEDRKGR